jgi:hypothetical protein
MRSPADMEVIQIEITNACPHSCSNCTRFCGHHQKPFFMEWNTFLNAIESLKRYSGIIGMMGGEPLLHPDFEKMTRYLNSCHGMLNNLKATRRPVKDFLTYTRAKHNANRVLNKCKGPGLWTSMPRHYYRYYELIQDSFIFQCLNDHHHPSFHQPLLVSRKDLEIPDKKWLQLRDACWIQNNWSASISPKGAFFCEVAAALDMLFDGPGGWPIEPGWWKRQPSDFRDQLHWCELCGAALDTKRRDANEQVDDASPTLIDYLRSIDSPKLKQGRVMTYPLDGQENTHAVPTFQTNQYIDDYSHRLGTTNRNLLPKTITAIIFADSLEPVDRIEDSTVKSLSIFDEVVLMIDTNFIDLAKFPSELVNNERIRVIQLSETGWGESLHSIMRSSSNPDWFLVFSSLQMIPEELPYMLKHTFINPGVLYTFSLSEDDKPSIELTSTYEPKKAFLLFNYMANSLRQAGSESIHRCKDLHTFMNLWPDDKRINLSTLPDELPVTDEHEWMQVVDRDFLEDDEFCHQFAATMAERVSPKTNILVIQSASYFLTRALIQVLIRLDFTVYLLTHKRFESYFRDILPSDRIVEFSNCDQIRFEALVELCDKTKNKIAFAGAVVPYSSPRGIIEPEDGYQDIEKVAVAMAGRILCGVNLKRQFVDGHANHHTIHENRWGY